MALGYGLGGGLNMITTKQASAAAETITLLGSKVNGGSSYSIAGGLLSVITGDGAGGTIDIRIDGVSILASAQSTNAASSSSLLVLNNDSSKLLGKGGDNITIITTEAALCQVTLFLSGTLENLT